MNFKKNGGKIKIRWKLQKKKLKVQAKKSDVGHIERKGSRKFGNYNDFR